MVKSGFEYKRIEPDDQTLVMLVSNKPNTNFRLIKITRQAI